MKSHIQTLEISLLRGENDRVEMLFDDLLRTLRDEEKVNFKYRSQEFANDDFTDCIRDYSESDFFRRPEK